jgi:menaquinone-9 beta-reductase
MNRPNKYEVIIAGAGPAGTSAAIRLARNGVKVLLVEQKKFPREKLCGEFISPECQDHFRELRVDNEIALSNPAHVTQTVFYASSGRHVRVPSEWFGSRASALGLSRAEMDQRLMSKAKELGVTVLEAATVADVLLQDRSVSGIRVKLERVTEDYDANIIIDATGRARVLIRKLESQLHGKPQSIKPGLVAFKAHLKNTKLEDGACEIYSYKGGYGGLSQIEKGLSNLCFIVAAKDVRRFNSDPELVVQNVVSRNRRAGYTLAEAEPSSEWLSVALESFGRHNPAPYPGLLAAGDAAAFIDPFTGSGMLMALESGELVAAAILQNLSTAHHGLFAQAYKSLYWTRFNSRLCISGLIRRVAFLPSAAEAAILFFRASERIRRKTAQATHAGRNDSIGVESHASKLT